MLYISSHRRDDKRRPENLTSDVCHIRDADVGGYRHFSLKCSRQDDEAGRPLVILKLIMRICLLSTEAGFLK